MPEILSEFHVSYNNVLNKLLKGIRGVRLNNRKVFSCIRSLDLIFKRFFFSSIKLHVHLYYLLNQLTEDLFCLIE